MREEPAVDQKKPGNKVGSTESSATDSQMSPVVSDPSGVSQAIAVRPPKELERADSH
jgi:hypothetical protein